MMPSPVTLSRFVPMGVMATISSLASVQSITVAASAPTLMVSVIAQNVRMSVDGITDPTSSSGIQLIAGQGPVFLEFVPGTVVKLIAETTGASVCYQSGRWEQ